MKRSMLVSLALLGGFVASQAEAQVAYRDVAKHQRGQAVFEASANACSAATGESPESAAYRQCMSRYGYRAQIATPARVAGPARGTRAVAAQCGLLDALFGCGAATPAQSATHRQARASRAAPPREAYEDDEVSSPSPTVSDSSIPSSPSPPAVDQTGMDTMNQANMAMAQQQVLIDAQIAQQTEQAANLTTNFGQ